MTSAFISSSKIAFNSTVLDSVYFINVRGKYNSIIKEKPYFEKAFIEYENQYGIKENALSEKAYKRVYSILG